MPANRIGPASGLSVDLERRLAILGEKDGIAMAGEGPLGDRPESHLDPAEADVALRLERLLPPAPDPPSRDGYASTPGCSSARSV